jgi:hypothetical protein
VSTSATFENNPVCSRRSTCCDTATGVRPMPITSSATSGITFCAAAAAAAAPADWGGGGGVGLNGGAIEIERSTTSSPVLLASRTSSTLQSGCSETVRLARSSHGGGQLGRASRCRSSAGSTRRRRRDAVGAADAPLEQVRDAVAQASDAADVSPRTPPHTTLRNLRRRLA